MFRLKAFKIKAFKLTPFKFRTCKMPKMAKTKAIRIPKMKKFKW